MDMFADQRSLALGDILLILEAEFADTEGEYQHTDVDTDQEKDTEEREEDASIEKNSNVRIFTVDILWSRCLYNSGLYFYG